MTETSNVLTLNMVLGGFATVLMALCTVVLKTLWYEIKEQRKASQDHALLLQADSEQLQLGVQAFGRGVVGVGGDERPQVTADAGIIPQECVLALQVAGHGRRQGRGLRLRRRRPA